MTESENGEDNFPLSYMGSRQVVWRSGSWSFVVPFGLNIGLVVIRRYWVGLHPRKLELVQKNFSSKRVALSASKEMSISYGMDH